MRLDKFLKVSRIIKRRTVAKDICDAGRITVNGRSAKAGAELKVGDVLKIGFGARALEVKVLDLSENVRACDATGLYEIISDVRAPKDDSWFE